MTNQKYSLSQFSSIKTLFDDMTVFIDGVKCLVQSTVDRQEFGYAQANLP